MRSTNGACCAHADRMVFRFTRKAIRSKQPFHIRSLIAHLCRLNHGLRECRQQKTIPGGVVPPARPGTINPHQRSTSTASMPPGFRAARTEVHANHRVNRQEQAQPQAVQLTLRLLALDETYERSGYDTTSRSRAANLGAMGVAPKISQTRSQRPSNKIHVFSWQTIFRVGGPRLQWPPRQLICNKVELNFGAH